MARNSTGIRVAVVDDDESLRRSMGRLLRAAGMQPEPYRSAEAFLADPRRGEFDCLLLDIRLDGISGIELNRRLALSGSTTPVVFLTGHDEPGVREEALRTPCVAYLLKTDPAETVLTAIRNAVRRRDSGSG